MITNAINLLFENNTANVLSNSNELYSMLESNIGNVSMDNNMSNTEFLIKFSAETAYNECVLVESTNYLLEDGEQKEKSGKLDKIKKILSNFWAGVKAFVVKVIKGIKMEAARYISFMKRATLFIHGNNIVGRICKIVKKSKQNKEIDDFLNEQDFFQSNIICHGSANRIQKYSLNCKLNDVLYKYENYISDFKIFSDDTETDNSIEKDEIIKDIINILDIDSLCNKINDNNSHKNEKDIVKRYTSMLSGFSVKIEKEDKIYNKIGIDFAIEFIYDINKTMNFLEKQGLKYFNSYIKQLEEWVKKMDKIEEESKTEIANLKTYNLDNLKVFREALTSSISICNCYTKFLFKLSAGIVSENKRFITYAKAKLKKVKEMYKKSGKSQEAKETDDIFKDLNDAFNDLDDKED